jgi:drug/metabolite transporter (DMT)-like permease
LRGFRGRLSSLAKGFAGRPRAAFGASVVAAALIWSTSYTATKIALVEVPPLTIGALRFLLAAMVLGVVVWLCGKLEKPGIADLGRLALGGVLGTTIYFSMENIGVDLATASDAALLVAAYPAITMGLEILIYRTSASWVRFAGVGLAMFGVYLIVGQSQQVGGEERLLGNIILVASGVIWAFYNFFTLRVGQSYPMLTVVFYQTVAGALAFVPVALIERQQWQIPSTGSSLMVAYLAVFCSVLAFLLYAYGLKELDAGSAVNLLNLVPVFGVGFAFLVLQEPVGLAQLFGGVVVIAGVTLGLRSGGRTGRSAGSEIQVVEVSETEEDKVYGERPT